MRIRFGLIALTALALSAMAPAPAAADATIAIGVKWLPLNYVQPFSVTSTDASGKALLAGFNSTNLNNYFGVFFLDGRLGFQLALDLGYSSRNDTTPAGATNLSFTQFGFSLGGKYYIRKPKGGSVSPYIYFDFYKYFASVSTSAMVPSGYENFVGGLASPLGIDLAFGAEYFFTPAFSLGAEILGLRYAYTAGNYSASPVGAGTNTTISETDHYVTFYTALSLNYRFDVAGSVRVREAREPDDLDERPRPRKRRAPPPPEGNEPPPPASESVD